MYYLDIFFLALSIDPLFLFDYLHLGEALGLLLDAKLKSKKACELLVSLSSDALSRHSSSSARIILDDKKVK